MYFILDLFSRTAKTVNDDTCQVVLERLVKIFALCFILDSQWADVLDMECLNVCRESVVDLLDAIRPDVIGLVDAFDYFR
eukprot:TRINITY_DN6114_c0_g1_i1.p4 TRINITY_DN6114_c0_g1~~TRINITY_DN6114_c0_g1_i1.p4  ORF type:complete len:80 (+),score=8.22 TRINITY_DN6114_c0_g1_i1:363-602(+)